jgi:transposase-like protein
MEAIRLLSNTVAVFPEFKLQVLSEIAVGKSVAQAAREYQLHLTLIGRWHKQHCQYSGRAFASNGRPYLDEASIAEL